MVDLINVLLRAVMCMAFIMWVVRPMLMTFSRRELDHAEIEEAAQLAISTAFQAYSGNNTNYYDDPQLAVFMAQNPGLPIPTEAEMAQRQKDNLEKAQAEEANALLAAADAPPPEAAIDASGNPVADGAPEPPTPGVAADGTPVPEDTDGAPQTQAQDVGEDEGEEAVETLEQMRERIKLEQKQKKPTIPPELLQNANSYEDQLMVVRMIVDQEQSRVASVIRNMIQVK